MSLSGRLALALALGALAAALNALAAALGANCHDFTIFWDAGRAVAHGLDPYDVIAASHPVPFYYPMPAAMVLAPIALLPLGVARALFVGGSVAALAWGLTSRGRWGALLLVSVSVTFAVVCGQWAPLLTAGAFIPWLSVLWVVKPPLGIALFVAYPHRWAAIGGLVLLGLSLVLYPGPSWVAQWLGAIGGTPQYMAPVQRPFGWLLLLSWLRWRTPSGRLLGMLALLPHTTFFPDTALLTLIPQSGRAAYVWTALGMLGAAITLPQTADTVPLELAREWPVLLLCVYLPSLALVLHAPSEPPAEARGLGR